MAYTLRINPKAHQDIQAIYDYILKDGESIAKGQAELIYKGLEKLADFPGIGGELSKKFSVKTDYRYLVVNAPYLAFYKIMQDTVDVYRILDGRQDYIRLLEL